MGTSIILVSSLLILWEWYTPMSRGLVSGIGIGLQLVLSSGVLLAQQLLVNPRLIKNTTVPAETQINTHIQYLFFAIIAAQVVGAIAALAFFRRNSIQLEREEDF